MENLIYILIGIAWVGYSLYSARQKAIQKQQSSRLPQGGPSQSSPLPIPGNQSGGKSIFDDILRELSGETRSIPQMEVPVKPINMGIPKTTSDTNQMYDRRIESNFVSSVQVDSPLGTSTMGIKPQHRPAKITREGIVSKRFNLREAVIYNELLNPKYF